MTPPQLSNRKSGRESGPAVHFSAPAKLKIAILLPDQPSWLVVRRAAELGAALVDAEPTVPATIEIAIGLPEQDDQRWRRIERAFQTRIPGCVVRHAEWARVPVSNARRMFHELDPSQDLEGIEEVSIPRDWGWNFQDCDLWVSFADPLLGAVLPLRPTAHYCSDLAVRYLPATVARSIHDEVWVRQTEAFRLWRQGLLLTTDPGTAVDAVSYAGVRRERIELLPDFLNQLPRFTPLANDDARRAKILWHVQDDILDDVENALRGVDIYLREGGLLKIFIVTDDSLVRLKRDQSSTAVEELKSRLDLPEFGYSSLDEYDRILPQFAALWSSRTASGDPEFAHDASRAGMRWLAPRFAQSERDVAITKVDTILYDRDNPLAIADALAALEAQLDSASAVQERRKIPDALERQAAFGFVIDRMLEMRVRG